MCGIFGILLRKGATLGAAPTQHLLANLYELSESRGKESAGLHVYQPEAGRAWTLKGAQRATELMASSAYAALLAGPVRQALGEANAAVAEPTALLAHSRLVTNGTAELPQNNQPVRSGHVSMIHNGICVNVDALWQRHPDLRRMAEVDTEVMAALVDAAQARGEGAAQATASMFDALKGAASVAWAHDAASTVTLATNTGDLYYCDRLAEGGYLIFASERYILETATREPLAAPPVQWLAPGQGVVVDLLGSGPLQPIVLTAPPAAEPQRGAAEGLFTRLSREATVHHDQVSGPVRAAAVVSHAADESLLRYDESRMRALKRCTRCILPETFPFIAFDAAGVCNYCASYRPRYAHMHPVQTKQAFIRSLEKYRRSGGRGHEPDALVAFSGGRDSSYGLHLIKKEFGLTPITFTYDWGMVTDLARRNIARICGQLGIQNILVSADIAEKRRNIRLNVAAWLNKPDLGLVPLFMAGDKHFFRVVNQLKRQTGITLDLWCANPLENTDFKSGFCGVPPDFGKKRVDHLSFTRKVRLASYYAWHFLRNPGYLNPSLADTFGAFLAYYVEPRRDFFFIFDHFIWNEDEVNHTLLGQYDWEIAPDSPSTWRIGDGTAPFYNYIYMTSSGFSEFDTFRSNQIREGQITRDKALEAVLVENRPRAQTLRWYLETIGLPFNDVVRRVNELDTRGLHR
jgi:glutamine---fructose-6-phosphate transaminase (isomerizing)